MILIVKAIFENKLVEDEELIFYSPNNTSDGMLKKAWVVDKDKRDIF